MKNLLIAVLIFLASCGIGHGATSYTAATCSQANVQTAVTSCRNDAQCTQVNIPSGSCTWNSSVSISKAMTVAGAGKTSTIITPSAIGVTLFYIGSGVRLTGIGFVTRPTTVHISVSGQNWVIDNCDFSQIDNGTGQGCYGISATGNTQGYQAKGVIHSNTFDDTRVIVNGTASFSGQNLTWSRDAGFGDDDAVYIEDNYMIRHGQGNVIDSNRASKYVARFNTVEYGYIEVHDQSNYITERSSRRVEIYNNSIHGDLELTGHYQAMVHLRGGEAKIFNNAITGTFTDSGIYLSVRRGYYANAGYGLCDGTKALDSNESGGWLCRDQPGSGKDTSLTTYTGTYPNFTTTWQAQEKKPVYLWGNNKGVYKYSEVPAGLLVENRDYYSGGTWGLQTSSSSPFNGTTGVGRGTYANRPTTCTTGVGYWATDRGGNWNTTNSDANDGTFYKCTSTNTWTNTYTPYTYPHPLRSGGVIIEDTTDPVILTKTPTGNTACDDDSPVDKTLTLTTSDSSGVECGYCVAGAGCDGNTNYSQMTRFASTGGSTHTQTLTGLACSTEHNYYVICRDTSPNQNEMDDAQLVTFTIGAPEGADPDAPSTTNPTPSSGYYQCGDNVPLSVTATDDNTPITCRYNATDVAYASMTGTFTAPTATVVKATDSSYSYSNYTDVGVYIGSSYGQVLGQSFQSGGGTLDSARFYLSKTGTPTGDIRVALYAHSGTLGTSSVGTGNPLAVSDTIPITTGVTTSVTPVTFTFSGDNRYALVDGTNYVIALEYSAADRLNVARDSTGNHQGNACWSTASGESGEWTVITGSDLIFDVYTMVTGSSAPPVIPNITIPLTVNSTNRRYFNDGSGRAVVLSGMQNFFLITPYNDSACLEDTPACGTQSFFEDWVDTQLALGHNFTRLWTGQSHYSWNTHPWNRTGPGNAGDGNLKFDMTSFNQDYFDDVVAKVEYALANNMYVGIMFLGSNVGIRTANNSWSGYAWNESNNINTALADAFTSTPESWYTTDTAALNIVKLTLKKFIDELNAYPNVIWEIANEPLLDTSDPNTIAWLTELVSYVKTYEATLPYQHLVWVTGNGFTGESAYNEYLDDTGADIVSPGASGTGTWLTAPTATFQGEPNILDTDHLWGYSDAGEESAVEAWVWKTFMRGYHPHFLDCDASGCGLSWTGTELRLGQVMTYANKMDLVNMTPSTSFAETEYALVHSAGTEFLVYQDDTGAFDVYLSDYPNTYTVEWLNVDTDVTSSGSDITGGSTVEMTPPDSGNYALYLKVKGIGGAGVHTATLATPACGQSYTYYSRCIDGLSNANTSSQTHTFTIQSAASNYIEFESGALVSPMTAVADAGANGGYYINTTSELTGTATISVPVATAGTYRIIARVNAADTGADSIFLTIDEGDAVMLALNHTFASANWNTWREEALHYITSGNAWAEYHVTLTADTHSFVFTGREVGAKLDYFYLDRIEIPLPPHIGTTRFIIGVGQTMVVSPTTGGCTVVIE